MQKLNNFIYMIAAAIVSNLVYAINGISAYAATYIERTSRIAAWPTTCQTAATYAADSGLGPIVGAPVIFQPSAVVYVSSRTDTPPPAPGNMPHMAPVADAMSAP